MILMVSERASCILDYMLVYLQIQIIFHLLQEMCGIWTLISLTKSKPDISKHLSDFWQLQNRGPDNSCFQTFPQAWVGFHRLAIMDSTSFQSNQPFILKQKHRTIVFVCNGEIYNFRELIETYKLDIQGNIDCLTIAKLYQKFQNKLQEWYELFKREIKGEFAFVLLEFDHLKSLKKVITGRDQIGVRPLYFHMPGNDSTQLLFTSEIKGAKNFNKSIQEYPPGVITKFELNQFAALHVSQHNFAWVYNVKQIFSLSEDRHLDRIKTAVINSIRRRLDADRPLAFLLSGGVDSSLVAAVSQRILGYPIKTFCCGMKGGTDFIYAKKVAQHIGSVHTQVNFNADQGLSLLKDVIYAAQTWDTTTIRASVGQYIVCRHIGTNTDYKVVLVGQGPDQVCSSYLFNWYAPSSQQLDKASKQYVKNIHLFDSRRGDRCICYWGLEGRVPFLDPQVIQAYWALPAEWRQPKFKGIEKWWLRKAFDGLDLLPAQVLWRKKQAFSDGVSSKQNSWYEIIQKKAQMQVTDAQLKDAQQKWPHHPPSTKQAYYFRKIFTQLYGQHRQQIIPKYWLPRWDKNGTLVSGYVDPSARTLQVYQGE